ncbi:hypothetical protein [Arvimicrobium flavum]|uniref:hypothetical protein n=1 Tax=Arvimicrobium flavum TaxID=3393320 RepID=UPI00237A81CE|nr:hypothetical protein [Mesorhizobium shangrilense]
MPLQNRVDPFGEIHATAARGIFTGNRGVIHDPRTKTLLRRRWSTRAWIICVCEFRGRRRDVMGRNAPSGNAGWTELFFLDEVTALAAGHRPCFYCRREQANAYAEAFGRALGIARPKVAEIDARLHRERLASGGVRRRLGVADLVALPAGAMVATGAAAFALGDGVAHRWTFGGYEAGVGIADAVGTEGVILLTPVSTVGALRNGYRPVWAEDASPAGSARK